MKKKIGRPTLESLRILKKAKLKIKDKETLAEINSVIKLIQGVKSGRIIAIIQH